MILNVVSGGNEDYYPLAIHTNIGAEVVVENEYETFTKIADDNGCAAFCLTEGVWNVTSTKDGQSKTISINISEDNNNSFDMIVNFMPQFTYSGKYELIAENTKDWHIKLKTTGDLIFTELVGANDGIEVFLVGGGNGGDAGNDSGGGRGGNGGATRTESVEISTNNVYAVTIVSSGGNTSAFGYNATAGGGSSGGKAGLLSMTDGGPHGGDGSNGKYAFGDTAHARYGAGGGGGAAAWDSASGSAGSGGDYGGGNGGAVNAVGSNGKSNTGGGGGGSGWGSNRGSSGGSGIVIIRNKRS